MASARPPFLRFDRPYLLPEAVTERPAHSEHRAGTEFVVVIDQVKPTLRANKHVMPYIDPYAPTEIPQEVIAAAVVSASHEVGAVHNSVKTQILAADSADDLADHILADTRRPYPIDTPQDRPIGLVPCVVVLVGSPEDIAFNTEITLQQKIRPDPGIPTASKRRIIKAVRGIRPGGKQRAPSES